MLIRPHLRYLMASQPRVDIDGMNEGKADIPDGALEREHGPAGTTVVIGELDQSIVNDLLEFGGIELVDELAALSCEDIARYTADFERGLSGHDAGAVVQSAHAIAGVSASIGATELAGVAGQLERMAANGKLGSAGTLGAELAESSLRVRHALEAHTARAAKRAEARAVAGAAAADLPVTMKILLVDDAHATRRFVRAALDTVMAFTVVGEASGGQQAVELARDLQPDVVLLDLALGDADGAGGLGILPDLIRTAPSTRVVVLSRTALTDGPATLAAGAIGYITKGLNAPDLIEQLTTMLGAPLLFKPRPAGAGAILIREEVTRAVLFDPDPLVRRTINWALVESNVQLVCEVAASDNVFAVLCSAVQLVGPDVVVLGDLPHIACAHLIRRLRQLAPGAILINYASGEPLEDTGAIPGVWAVRRGDIEGLTSLVRGVLAIG